MADTRGAERFTWGDGDIVWEDEDVSEIDEVTKAKTLLNNVGIDFPLLPGNLVSDFKQREKSCFSTMPVTLSPYCFDEYVRAGIAAHIQDYMLISHAGHGANSYAWHYYLVNGPLRLFLQLAWGGVYMDKDRTTRTVNECFALVSQLFSAVQQRSDADRLQSNDPLIIVGSEFYGSYWIKPGGEGQRIPDKERPKVNPSFMLAEVLHWLRVTT